MKKIYLDNNATTALDPRVIEVMLEEMHSHPSNPSSMHFWGRAAKEKLNRARKAIASVLETFPNQILFTSGGTEGLNHFIRSVSFGHIITSNIEHSSIYRTVQNLEKKGCLVSYLPCGLEGAVTTKQVEEALSSNTRLIVLSAVNSETGVKNPIEEIAKLAKRYKVPFVVDAVALLGKEKFQIPDGVSAMAFSGHKFHGPKGTGFVWTDSNYKIEPFITGGDQEFSQRAGTENLAGILGLAKAVELLQEELPQATQRMVVLRDSLEQRLKEEIPDLIVNGKGSRICNTSNLCFPNVDGELLMMHLDLAGIAVSHGSACSSGALEPSRVLLNMGLPKSLAKSSIRFSLSRLTTQEEIDLCITAVTHITQKSLQMMN